nr:PREDICTED: putative Polycomb group protein ASXL3 [Latimeria chalumnae]|eukprot:XP_005998280.1 PREDICTED: putative Polycomb group protein ASXL3 [Latimeria chalumnae]
MAQHQVTDRYLPTAVLQALEKHPNTPMTAKQILEVIQKEGLKETSGTSPLACLNAMLHTNTRVGDGTFFKIPGKSGLYALKKEESTCPTDGTLDLGCESELEGSEMADVNHSNGDEVGVCPKLVAEETSSEQDPSPTTAAVQNKLVSSTQQHTKKALKQALRQQQKRRNGVSMMVNKTVPRVVLTPLKVSDEQSDSPSGSESKNGEADSSDKEVKPGQKSPAGKQTSQHLKRLKKSGLGHLKWTKAEDIDIETPGSILVNTNLRALINKHTFASLPQHFQQYLLFLLPEVDRQMGSDGVLRLSSSALNNEFFAYAAQGWKQRLAEGEFTPEMQLRIRQEIEKEKKIEPWKEKFFERFYGEKLGMTEEESENLTLAQECVEDEGTSFSDSSNLPGPSTQSSPEKNEYRNTEILYLPEKDSNLSAGDMESVPAKELDRQEAVEAILIPGVPDISVEESVIQEEIAEEIDSNLYECHEENPKLEQEVGDPEEVISAKEENTEPVLAADHCEPSAVMKHFPEEFLQPEEEVVTNSENTVNEILDVVEQLVEPSLTPLSASSEEAEGNNSENQPLIFKEESTAAYERAPEALDSSDLSSDGEVIELLDLQSNSEQQTHEREHVSESSCSSETSESTSTDSVISVEKGQHSSEQPDTSAETSLLPEESEIKSLEDQSQPDQVAEKVDTALQPEAASVCIGAEDESLIIQHEQEPCPPEEPPASVKSDTSVIPNIHESESMSVQQRKSQDAPEEVQSFLTLNSSLETLESKSLEYPQIKPQITPEKSCVSTSSEEAVPPEVLKSKTMNLEQNVPERLHAPLPSETTVLSETTVNKNFDLQETKLQPVHDRPCSPPSETCSVPEMPRSKHYKLQQGKPEASFSFKSSEPAKSHEMARSDSREPEISKRKTVEQSSFGSCKEKRPRIEDDQPSCSNIPTEKDLPPKEEPKVPPLKIQLSRIGPPFIIKSQPAPKPEPRASTNTSAGGKNTGARTLADIKARAQQARAQREAAAAAAVAAAASIVSGGTAGPGEGGKTRTLAHIKEQTKAKLFAKHQARAYLLQASKEAKSLSSAKEGLSTDAQPAVESKNEGPIGVIIVNPNCRSPVKSSIPVSESSARHSVQNSKDNITIPRSSTKIIVPTSSESNNVVPVCLDNAAIPVPVSNAPVPITIDRASFTQSVDDSLDLMPDSAAATSSVQTITAGANVPCSLSGSVVPKCSNNTNIPVSIASLFASGSHEPITSSSGNSNRLLLSAGTAMMPVSNETTPVPASSDKNTLPNTVHNVSVLISPSGTTTPFSFERTTMSSSPDQPTFTACGSSKAVSNCNENIGVPISLERPATLQPTDHVTSVGTYTSTIKKTSNVQSSTGLGCVTDLSANSQQMCFTQTVVNRSIPCKVIVDHSTSFSSTLPPPPSEGNAEISKGLEHEAKRTEVALQNRIRPQVSVISKSEPLSNEGTEQNASFNTIPNPVRKSLKSVCTEVVGTNVTQQDKRIEGIVSNLDFTEQIQSSSSLDHGTNIVCHKQYISTNDRLAWPDEENLKIDQKIAQHLNAKELKAHFNEKTLENDKASTSRCAHQIELHDRHPVSGIAVSVKLEEEYPEKQFAMDSEEFPVAEIQTCASEFPASSQTKISKTVALNPAEDSVLLIADNQRRVPSAGGSVSCRLSLVEANNPLVTQLLQGNLPLEKVLPQPRSGAKLEINRLPLPLQSTSVCKATAAERNVIETAPSSLSPDGKGHAVGSTGSSQIRKRDNHPKKRIAKSVGEHPQVKCELVKPLTDAEAKMASCAFSSNLNQGGQGQPFKQEWMNKHLIQNRITHSPEIKQQKRPLPSCSFQQSSVNVDKNGSFPAEDNTPQRQLFYQISATVIGSTPTVSKATSGYSALNTLAANRHLKQKGLGEVNSSTTIDQLRSGSIFSPNFQIKQADDMASVSQAIQNKSLVHNSPANGGEAPSDQKPPMVTMETTKRLSWPPSTNICSSIKTEPVSFDEGLSSSCELGVKQTSYDQSEVKEQFKAFAFKNSEFSSYLLSEQHRPFTHLASQRTIQQQQPHQSLSGNYSTIHFGSSSFKRAASEVEKSIGIMGSGPISVANLPTHNPPITVQKFADSSNADELELKCSCRLKAMIVCKGCGAFCHDDCIGPSKLCVACLVVR